MAYKTQLKVLLVEDNLSDSTLFSKSLNKSSLAGFEIHNATCLADGLEKSKVTNFDTIILDLSLPDSDGLETLDAFRPTSSSAPIIVLTGLSNKRIGIEAMQKGAEEYLIKGEELSLEHLDRSILLTIERKKGRLQSETALPSLATTLFQNFKVGDLAIDLAKQSVAYQAGDQQRTVPLTPIEFKILVLLARNPGKVLSRSQIVAEIWNDDRQISSRTVDKHMSALKRKCAPALDQLKCVYGVGYHITE
jgi:DNA-binding response OmpR family regulator